MTIGERLSKLRKEKGLSRVAFAEKIGIPQTTLRNYESDIREPGHNFLIQMAKEFNVSTDYLLGLTDTLQVANPNFKTTLDEQDHIKKYRDLDSHGKKVVDVVLDEEYNRILSYEETQDNSNEYFIAYYDLPASAGTGAFLHTDTTQKLKVPETPTTLRADFAIRVSGDSMEPKYYDGDILLVEETPDIEIGQIRIFVLNGTGYVKKKGTNGLISLNPKYDPIEPCGSDDCRCIGKVIGKL